MINLINKRFVTLSKFSYSFSSSQSQQARKTCLNALHKQLGGKMVQFAGYQLPVQYKAGVMKQHLHCRSSASLFDVSHMGQITIKGKNALQLVQRCTVGSTTRKSMKIDNTQLDQCYLTLFTNINAGIIDDGIITIVSNQLIRMVVNGANKYIVLKQLNQINSKEGFGTNIHLAQDRGLIAFQGPKTPQIMQKVFTNQFNFSNAPFMSQFILKDSHKEQLIVSRCGYTGQDGFQIAGSQNSIVNITKKLLEFKEEVLPTGLGARDSLRTQAGLCLHGHDISASTNPSQAVLMWTVYKPQTTKSRLKFIGQQKLRNQIQQVKAGKKKIKKRIGFAVQGAGVIRQNCKVFSSDSNKEIGLTTTGTFGPSLKQCVGMAYVDQDFIKQGTKLQAQQRGKLTEIIVKKMPFIPAKYYKQKKWQ